MCRGTFIHSHRTNPREKEIPLHIQSDVERPLEFVSRDVTQRRGVKKKKP